MIQESLHLFPSDYRFSHHRLQKKATDPDLSVSSVRHVLHFAPKPLAIFTGFPGTVLGTVVERAIKFDV